MQDTVKERLAKELAASIRHIREGRWEPFCEAANQSNIDPYLALAVILVGLVESTLDETDVSRN
jgi:hypothetical protein